MGVLGLISNNIIGQIKCTYSTTSFFFCVCVCAVYYSSTVYIPKKKQVLGGTDCIGFWHSPSYVPVGLFRLQKQCIFHTPNFTEEDRRSLGLGVYCTEEGCMYRSLTLSRYLFSFTHRRNLSYSSCKGRCFLEKKWSAAMAPIGTVESLWPWTRMRSSPLSPLPMMSRIARLPTHPHLLGMKMDLKGLKLDTWLWVCISALRFPPHC